MVNQVVLGIPAALDLFQTKGIFKFLADGCGATITCGSMITKMAITKILNDTNFITQEE
jgi:NifU-like protein involved in Fe-S cluster formation